MTSCACEVVLEACSLEKALYKLVTGVEVPAIGFGTGVVRAYSRNPALFLRRRIRPLLSSIKHMRMHRQFYSDLYMDRVVEKAIQKGYRLFDSGRIYGWSEPMIGRGINRSGIDREELFLVSKISDMDLTRKTSPDTVLDNLKISLRYLRADYLDAYLLHWPHGDWVSIYKEMESAYDEGLVRAIGVCNFHMEHFQELEAHAKYMPMICQTELHPLNSKKELRTYCRDHGILMIAHTPTGRMCERIRNSKVLRELARVHNKTIAQIIVRWHYQNGVVPIIATMSGEHMQENQDIFDFELTSAEMDSIEGMDERYVMLPGNGIDDPRYIYNL